MGIGHKDYIENVGGDIIKTSIDNDVLIKLGLYGISTKHLRAAIRGLPDHGVSDSTYVAILEAAVRQTKNFDKLFEAITGYDMDLEEWLDLRA